MATPLLELDGVSKRFGQVVIATDLSLTIGPGDTVGIVGPNGGGKNRLFWPISRDLGPGSGAGPFAALGRGPVRRAPGDQARLGRPVPAGNRPDLPGAAAVRGHDRVREPAGGGPAGRRTAAPGQLRGRGGCAGTNP